MLIYWAGSPRGGAGGMVLDVGRGARGPGAAQPAAARARIRQAARRIIAAFCHQRFGLTSEMLGKIARRV
jgi:hypothetical protein